MTESKPQKRKLAPYLSPLGVWALALGTSIGWGSLVVTANNYLLNAGPWGSIAGLLVGAVVMVVIARNYHYMINCFPDAGGAYTYSKAVFGHDQGFATAWFLVLTYIAMFWANATSLPLFAKFFLGDMFQFGFHYTVFGYEVHFGEALLTIVAILLVTLLCMRSRKVAMYLLIGFVVLLSLGIVAAFAGAAIGFPAVGPGSVEPGFLPDKSILAQVMAIACISPWAFVGFENISHAAEEYAFPHSKAFRIMALAIASAFALYVLVMLLSVMAYPPEYDSWFEYLSDLGNLDGFKALPAFYAAYHYLGNAGIALLMAALFGLVITSLIGNIMALSRLFYSLANDAVIPRAFAFVSEKLVPSRAVLLVALLSVFIPFLGRTAVGWIVDVTTIGAVIVYGLVSASASKVARARGDRTERITGLIGVVVMVAFGAQVLIPSLLTSHSMETESFFLFAAWGIIGFVYFRVLLSRDKEGRFGRSVVVWVALLALVLFTVFIWMDQSIMATENAMIDQFNAQMLAGIGANPELQAEEAAISQELLDLRDSSLTIIAIAAALFAISSALLLSNFSHMSRWVQRSEKELDITRDIIYTDPLTGLPSMARFQELAQAIVAEMRAQGDRPAAVALDLMGMSDYNSQHGREAGDKLLVAFAGVLRAHFGGDACSRFAGDHFYAYAVEDGLASRIEAVFEDFKGTDTKATLPIRVGVYVCEKDDDIVSVGFDRARAACDLDRKTWQSHVSWFIDGMSEEARMRLHVLDRVDQAIDERWIRPYYQAVVRPSTGEVCHEEALARWIDPEFGFLSPGQFIPILEEANLLHKVDLHMVDCILADIAEKRREGVPVVPVSVNVSLGDLGQLDIVGEIMGKVDAAGVAHDLLVIEFTESVAMEDADLFRKEVGRLRSAGFEVWMDDFGSGYSSLNSLKDFDFDVVKLDMDFLRGNRGERTWDIIGGVVDVVEKLGMRALAEGVETEAQAWRLEEEGCDMLQGFYFASPQPLETIIGEVRSGSGPRREAR